MYDRILVPTDGTTAAASAIDEAVELAALSGATVVGLYVVDTRDYNTLPESKWLGVQEELDAAGERALSAVEDRATSAGVHARTELRRGVPHQEILDCADEEDVDVIVMATHGRRGVRRFLLGSVTENVLRQATVPVFVVRAEEMEE